MAPTLQEQVPVGLECESGEDVVISGMSGAYPQSSNIKELSNILYNKINPVTDKDSRWNYNHPELPQHVGKAPGLKYFDAQFFKVHFRLSLNMDSMSRKLLEQTYQAIFDAGVSPEHLSGKKVGVYIGSCFSETEKACFYVASIRTGFGIAGCSKAMFANRISYWLNLKGPSLSIDATCASSLVALEKAYEAIKRGDCEAAIVGGANICLHPQSSVHYGRIIKLCMDGKTKSFDKDADGCARADAINVLFLQRAKYANRVYAKVCHVKSEFGPLSNELGQMYGPYRNPTEVTKFVNQFYDDAGVAPSSVEYVEAFGIAVPAADKSELEVISNVFCKKRGTPLFVGSVTSNIGYTEAASGISAITKVLLGYQKGEMAANLHFQTPRDDIDALRDGRMQIVSEHQKFNRSYTAVNSVSVTGLNVHVLLHGRYKPKDLSRYRSNIPHLVLLSGRQESAVAKVFKDLKSRPVDAEELALLHNIHEKNISGHLGRGYTVLATNEKNETVSLVEKVDYCDDAKKPLWFVYSGMGSQWAGMGTQLMRIPIFAAAIDRCMKVLQPKGIDIIKIITSTDKTTFDNILHSFVGIAAVQIGLTDVLREIGMVPDNIIGHSVGELGCAYADGCLTAEEMILSAYSRGLVSVQTPFIKGSMAAVGVGYEDIISKCPPEIEVACHNGPESCTISGPAEPMRDFVTKLTEQGIFAKEVPCSNIAYHSRYIKEAGPGLLKYLREVIKTPRARSKKWLSTSVAQDKWDEPLAQLSSAEYHTNNLLNPVLFEETARLIPENAVLIEVAPHGLLQAILKRSLPASCVNIPLTRRGHADNALFVLEAVGKMYIEGYNPMVKALYPKMQFPVSSETPSLSHHVEWVHNELWSVPLYVAASRKTAAAARYVVSMYDDEHTYLKGNMHGNETLYPFSGALMAVWDTMAMVLGEPRRGLSVQFHNVHLHEQPKLAWEKLLKFGVQLQRGNGYFEVGDENVTLISGYIYAEATQSEIYKTIFKHKTDGVKLDALDIYKMFYDRESYYKGEFRSIKSTNEEMTSAEVAWTGNWVTLLDSLMQIHALRRSHDGFSQPRFIRKLYFDMTQHCLAQVGAESKGTLHLELDPLQSNSRVGGIAMEDIKFKDLTHFTRELVDLKAQKFSPFFQFNTVKAPEALNVFLQIAAENRNKEVVNILEILTSRHSLKHELVSLIETVPGAKFSFNQVNIEDLPSCRQQAMQADLVVIRNISISENICEILHGALAQDTFVLSTENSVTSSVPQALCRPVASATTEVGRLVLSRWRPATDHSASAAVSVDSVRDLAMLRSTRQNLRPDHKLIVLTRFPAPNGLKDLVQQWRKEPQRNKIHVVMINQKNVKDQNLDQLPNFDLAFNVLDNGIWGGQFYTLTEQHKASHRNVSLRSGELGNLETLYWEEASEPRPNDIAVEVHYAGLNVRDAKRATGVAVFKHEYEEDFGYGMDFSGVTESGERVMGVVPSGAATSRVSALPTMLWPVPAHWTMEDAATVPLPYAQAYYILGLKCELCRGNSLLVHGATGALGLAVISIALANDCKVFATVSDERKKRFLRSIYPQIPDDHIGNSRDCTFGDMIMHHTKGNGCTIVLLCADNDLKHLAIQCVGLSGVAIDTNQIPDKQEFNFGMNSLVKERNYTRVDFSSLFKEETFYELELIQRLVSDGIAKGIVRPLSRVSYRATEAGRAMRLLAASRHRGRALLRMQDAVIPAVPKIAVTTGKSHVVFAKSDSAVLAARLISRLADRGASRVVLSLQQDYENVSDDYVAMKIKMWKKQGITVKLSTKTLSDADQVRSVVREGVTQGPVEGVYVVATGSKEHTAQAKLASLVEQLDVVTRKLCPGIRYFVVIAEENNIGQDVCIKRGLDKLPSTAVSLPKLQEFDETASTESGEGLSCSAAVEAVERAVRASAPVLAVRPLTLTRRSLVQQLQQIVGISITEKTPASMTLEQVGLDLEKADLVSCLLGDALDAVHLSKEELLKITVSMIREFERVEEQKSAEITGLSVVFDHVVSDELLANHDLIFMPTLTNSGQARDDEFLVDETYIVMIPGLEGHHERFRSLCERLKLPAVVMQPGLDFPHETVEDMAQRMVQVMLHKLKPKKLIYLLGYSFGVLVALEMAKALEKLGLTGVVFCVDASPDAFPESLEAWLREAGATDPATLQDSIVHHMYQLMTGTSSDALNQSLQRAYTWNDKVEVCVASLRGRVAHSSQYARALIEGAYFRIDQARKYSAKALKAAPLQWQLVLLRSRHQISQTNDLGLASYSTQVPIVYELDLDHARALDDLRCSNIVNRHLDSTIWETFEKRNLCDTYLLNANTFMGESKTDVAE